MNSETVRDGAAPDLDSLSTPEQEHLKGTGLVPATTAVNAPVPAPENGRFAELPRLHPAPGRCIIRIVPRLIRVTATDGSDIVGELDGRFEHQPMIGSLQAIGDPTSDKERVVAQWATEQAESGALFVFSQYGAGSEYWNKEMAKMVAFGYDFTWFQGLRLFDICQLSATVENTGAFGELPRTGPDADTVERVDVNQSDLEQLQRDARSKWKVTHTQPVKPLKGVS